MKRILLLMLALCLFLTSPALAQRIDMDNAHVAFDYPDTRLVVSPQLCTTYAQLLADAGWTRSPSPLTCARRALKAALTAPISPSGSAC